MYVPSDEACTMQSGETPISAATIAASLAQTAAADASVAAADSAWQGILSRDWQSFAGLGPYVALQLRNLAPSATPGDNGSALNLPGSAVPVSVVSQGNPSGPAGQFVQRFGLSPVQTYTGPPPSPGSVMSLVYGGSHQSLDTGPGVYAAPTPDASQGYGGDCITPDAVFALPWGESGDINTPGTVASLDSSSGATGDSGLWLLGLLVLAGVAYATDKYDKRRGRR